MANINAYIEQAIRGIEAEREQKIAGIKATIMREKVEPLTIELDTKRDKALQELQVKLNADITALQEAFASERQAIIEATEKQKSETATAMVAAETGSITAEYDDKLAELRKLIEG